MDRLTRNGLSWLSGILQAVACVGLLVAALTWVPEAPREGGAPRAERGQVSGSRRAGARVLERSESTDLRKSEAPGSQKGDAPRTRKSEWRSRSGREDLRGIESGGPGGLPGNDSKLPRRRWMPRPRVALAWPAQMLGDLRLSAL